ncbi:TPA: hypothetical protein ACISW2_003720 [Salmonella enterica subsp. enterica serovar Charity]|nr:hypothetical protein [Salmonella enterica]EJN1845437.1 hypothetical protein [Salmonella enterica]EKH2475007.1 hypothetical protein [Salmonella enterica]ELD7009394.1 hypothetical protein [Salmonella enterica]
MSSNAAFKIAFMRAWRLSYLIENAHHELIIREGVAYAVWGGRGKFISDTNLTQPIYLLRPNLKNRFTGITYDLTEAWYKNKCKDRY